MSVRDWRCTAERSFSIRGSGYYLTEKAERLFAVERPNPFGRAVKPRCRRCREQLGECECSGVRR